MKPPLIAAVAVLLLASAAQAQTVILVRHAEKVDESADPELTAAGQARARDLAASLAGARVKTVISTAFKRTRGTAAPTAAGAHVPVRELAGDPPIVAAAVRKLPAGATVLVVGHSNTIPAIAKALGDKAPLKIDGCFDAMTVIQLGVAPKVIHTRYGAPSSPC